MKHFLLLTYSIYFTFLMIVPCNHTVLYANLVENVFNVHLHEHCSHNHGEEIPKHQDDTNHHHSCTPFCACGITHFVLNQPPFNWGFNPNVSYSNKTYPISTTVWATNQDVYKEGMVKDVWNPPRV